MKNLLPRTLALSIVMLLGLSGCSTMQTQGTIAGSNNGSTPTQNSPMATAQNVGMNLIKSAVDTRCRSEIESQNMWRIARVAMSAEQEEAAKTKICGCVSEQAPQHVTLTDVANAALNAQYRTQVVTKVVTESLQSCYSSVVK